MQFLERLLRLLVRLGPRARLGCGLVLGAGCALSDGRTPAAAVVGTTLVPFVPGKRTTTGADSPRLLLIRAFVDRVLGVDQHGDLGVSDAVQIHPGRYAGRKLERLNERLVVARREAGNLCVTQEDALIDLAVLTDQQEPHRERARVARPQVLHGRRDLERLAPRKRIGRQQDRRSRQVRQGRRAGRGRRRTG